MKKLIIATIAFLAISPLSAQICPANDSALMGSGFAQDVFYSFRKFAQTGNGAVKSVSNTNWHMAISVQFSSFPANPANGVAIRVNSPLGENAQMGTTGTTLVKLNGANPSDWRNIDTTGLSSLPELVDSDSTWNLSAFTSGYPKTNPFDFIWGTYNQSSKAVVGTQVFVLYNKSAGWYKKIFIKELAYDTLWDIVISNIDNSDSVNLKINKKMYSKRMFVYYDVVNNVLNDREPDTDQWDAVWTKYKGMINFMGSKIPYTVTGILTNPKVTVAKNIGKKCNEVWLSNKTAQVYPSISNIGHDWKAFDQQTFKYTITDTFVYFVNALDSNTYKVTMKNFTGGSQGKTTFNLYEATSSIQSISSNNTISIYPNPTNSTLQIESESAINSVLVYDMQGRQVLSSELSQINISDLNNGIYMLLISTADGVYQHTIIKN